MAIQSSKSGKTSRRLSSHLQGWFTANGFFECGKEWYHFQQEHMVSKMIVKVFSGSVEIVTKGTVQ